ncbi:MAG TPA: hypothetical protein ENJ95_01535 [Bacteroidetes bacterium]|nr:hypothetical protein [Bacteroidota bacterium]
MKFKLILILLLPFLGHGQGLYQTIVYGSLEEDKEYQELTLEKEKLNNKFELLFHDIKIDIEKNQQIQELINSIIYGLDSLLILQFNNPETKKILNQNKLDKDLLIDLAQKYKSSIATEYALKRIYLYKYNQQIPASDNQDIKKEIRKYSLDNNEKILEIGAGNIQFSRQLGKKVKNCMIFLNEIDKYALKGIFYHLIWDKQIVEITNQRHNSYVVIEGNDKTTGIEAEQFDKIIIRNAVHHFIAPNLMFNSIKLSMTQDSELIIRERFSEECKEFCCDQLLTKEKFESLLQQNGFIRIYSKKLNAKGRNKYWIYKFKKTAANNVYGNHVG